MEHVFTVTMNSQCSDQNLVSHLKGEPCRNRNDPEQDSSKEPSQCIQLEITGVKADASRCADVPLSTRADLSRDGGTDDDFGDRRDVGQITSQSGNHDCDKEVEVGEETDVAEVAAPPVINLSCRLCPEGADSEEPLFHCPCRCPNVFVHRTCLEDWLYKNPEWTCSSCGALFPVRRSTKPLWRWFWEEDSREDAALFFANIVFSLGNVGVLSMAWLYVLVEYKCKTWLSSASLATALLLLSIFWVTFGCLRFHVLYKSYAIWRRANTTLKVLLVDKIADVPA